MNEIRKQLTCTIVELRALHALLVENKLSTQWTAREMLEQLSFIRGYVESILESGDQSE